MGLFDWLGGHRDERAPEPQLPAVPPAPTADDIQRALVDVEQLVSTGVPAPVASRVYAITRTIREILPRLSSTDAASLDTYSVMATATDYLPQALGAYLRLPRDWADSRPLQNGKTALLLLIDQLDLLSVTVDKILDAMARADATALLANGAFLQQKFGAASDGGALGLGVSAAPDQSHPLNLEA